MAMLRVRHVVGLWAGLGSGLSAVSLCRRVRTLRDR
jgi:hypothetical protein